MAAKKGELVPVGKHPADLLNGNRESLSAWLSLYMELEVGGSSENTGKAKKRDLQAFLDYFAGATRSDSPDQWTRSVTTGFSRKLGKEKKPTTVNRVLATIRHATAWVHRHRPFLAGNPCERIQELSLDEPEWKGLTDLEVTRLKSAAEQLLRLKKRKDQQPVRDFAIFTVLLSTGLRVSELVSLDIGQYEGKHFHNVKRKGKKVSRKVFLVKDAKEALERYIDEVRGRENGPLFLTRGGKRIGRFDVNNVLAGLAGQANAALPDEEKIRLTPHVLRHTMLRRAAEKFGVQYAMELSGHTSSNYIWRYVKPTDEQKEKALEEMF
jgi:integrase/recombinase XerD